jgi:hypothetical protein
MAPVTSPPFFSFCAGKLLVWRRWKARRMDGLYSFYPFLHLRLFLCISFSLLSLSLSHVTKFMVLYFASSSLFSFFSIIPSYLMCPDVFALRLKSRSWLAEKDIIRSLVVSLHSTVPIARQSFSPRFLSFRFGRQIGTFYIPTFQCAYIYEIESLYEIPSQIQYRMGQPRKFCGEI